MTTIELHTEIAAPLNVCYDLARSIDVHLHSMNRHQERAIAGKTSGLINVNEHVTWEAKHFLTVQRMTVAITEAIRPFYFCDEMKEGPFTFMKHTHVFQSINGKTAMRDYFEYGVPFGSFGRWFDKIVLRDYLETLLLQRNQFIKQLAESGRWMKFIPMDYAA